MEIKPHGSVLNFMLPLQSGKELFNGTTGYNAIQFGIAIILGLVATWLSFTCNEIGTDSPIGSVILQILYSLLAFLFGGLYILYYFVVHYLGNDILMSVGFASSCPSRQKIKNNQS